MITVIRIRGEAKNVFAILDLMAKKAGQLTTGEIARLKSR